MFGFLKALLGGASVPGVTPAEAQRLMRSGALVLDVREQGERQTAHISGSRHIPLGQLAARLGELPKDQPIVCQCASGKRSALAAGQLAAQGFDVRNLTGGLAAWQAAGLPIK